MNKHFEQQPKRHAEFIEPPNALKKKVGSGGLSDDILAKTQSLLEKQTENFEPLAELYLSQLKNSVDRVYNRKFYDEPEELIEGILAPAMQIKSNGGMFGYPLVTEIGDMLIHFLEVVEEADYECLEIVTAFHTTLKVIIKGEIKSGESQEAKALKQALHDACQRYFTAFPNRINLVEFQ